MDWGIAAVAHNNPQHNKETLRMGVIPARLYKNKKVR